MKFKITIAACFLTLSLFSCHEEFLEEEVFTFLSPNNFYSDANEAIIAVNACYDVLQQRDLYQQVMYRVGDFPSDIADQDGRLSPFHTFTVNSQNGDLTSLYQSSYNGINRCNAVIDRVPAIDMNEELKNRIVGEAKFIRGLLYFNLIRVFGNIPLVDKETTGMENISPTNVNTSETVWQLIIDDLKFSEAHLPPSYTGNDLGRATKGAAMGILAKVYLTRSGFGVQDEWMMAANKLQ